MLAVATGWRKDQKYAIRTPVALQYCTLLEIKERESADIRHTARAAGPNKKGTLSYRGGFVEARDNSGNNVWH